MTYQLAFAIVKKSLQMGESGVIPANRGLAMAIGTAGRHHRQVEQSGLSGNPARRI
jgi:hypothetical protein